jgi:hypothetical protein
MSTSFEPQFNAQSEMSDPMLTGDMLTGTGAAARAGVVNRTHRVVRQRAKVMQERRSQVRSLMVPLIICSALLILVIVAVWSGLYQYEAAEAAEAVQADVAALAATTDANNHFLVVLLWFVPVSLAALAAVWLSRVRGGTDHRTTR